MKDGDQRLIRAAGSVSVMTALSRVTGFARDCPRGRYCEFIDAGVRSCARRTLLSGTAMFAALLLVLRRIDVPALPTIVLKGAALALPIAGGGAVCLAAAWTLGSEEMRLLRSIMRGGAR